MTQTHPWHVAATALADAGCDVVFGLPSDEPGLMDAAEAQQRLRVVGVRDQRVGACAAIGHAAGTGRPAVLAVESGPSFANTLTGLLEASSLGAPVVVVTTRVPVDEIGKGAFQYTDQAGMAASLTKWRFLVERPRQLVWALRRAVHLAVNGAPGVVLVEISHEVLNGVVEPPVAQHPVRRIRGGADPEDVRRARNLLAAARFPVLVAGGGCATPDAHAGLRRLAEALGAPVFTTAAGRGAFDERHPLACGLVGLYTTPPADSLLAEADVVVAVGSRLEETARMGWDSFGSKRLIHIDASSQAFLAALEPAAALLGDAGVVLEQLLEGLTPSHEAARERAGRVHAVRAEMFRRYGSTGPDEAADAALTVRSALGLLQETFETPTTVVQENGLHDMWGYHFPVLTVDEDTRVIVPGEQTMVGFGLPAAVGAAVADPTRRTVLVCGDGALEMSTAALSTAAEQRCGITVLVLDNRGYGWPRLLRTSAGADDRATRFRAPSLGPAAVLASGGWTAVVRTRAELRAALTEAAKVTADGRTAVITVPVDDADVPVGVRGLLGTEAEAPTGPDRTPTPTARPSDVSEVRPS
ncbi:thiamine pyrophosphate-binding protein [Streptomyces cremeus]|uniref:Thiamine pyrophosphate-binding protein n=1 Tax=Streptomyces cremeus TaxID=66881 RepID=A0ABV5PI12_STRCM